MVTKYIYANLPSNYYTKFLLGKQWTYKAGIYVCHLNNTKLTQIHKINLAAIYFHQFNLPS